MMATDAAAALGITWAHGIDIWLTPAEVNQGSAAGTLREVESETNRRTAHPSYAASILDDHIMGALAELAVCKWTGTYFEARLRSFKGAPDVGSRTDVRATRPHPRIDPPDLTMPVYEGDSDAHQHVFVIAQAPWFRLVGWIDTADAKRPDYWRANRWAKRDAFWVPQSHLRPMSSLRMPL